MKTRLWCGTWYDMDIDFEEIFAGGSMKYLGYGKEICPTTNREHLQFFALFRNPRESAKGVAKVFANGGDIQGKVFPCKGNLKQNEDYCAKEGNYKHLGERPKQGERGDIEGCMQLVRDGIPELEIANLAPRLWCQYGRRFEEYRALLQPDRDWVPDVRVWWGPPGTGKTKAAIEWLEEYDDVSFTSGGFFIGYHNHDSVLLDDFDYRSMPRDLFLKVTDRYKLTVNVKNGEKKWNPRKIAITSNKDPEEWFYGDPMAIIRRISKVTFLEQKMEQK